MSAESFAKRQRKFDVRLAYINSDASTVVYTVDVGMFRLTINLLNLQGKAPEKEDRETVGKGGFGTVLTKEVAGTEFVAKILSRNQSIPEDIEEIV